MIKFNPNQNLHINLFYTKFVCTVSFLTLVIFKKQFSIFYNSDFDPRGPKAILIKVHIKFDKNILYQL
jgi:hypothetical protein